MSGRSSVLWFTLIMRGGQRQRVLFVKSRLVTPLDGVAEVGELLSDFKRFCEWNEWKLESLD